jgi:cytochrome c biogenesis protein CcmG, thiol:disulfide interchange protein DsbE
MRIRSVVIFVSLPWLVATATFAQTVVGSTAPKFEVTALDGTTKLGSSIGSRKVTIVNFWATWCAPCKAEMPAIDEYYKRHKGDGLEVIAISMDATKDLNKVKAFAQQYSFPIAHKDSSNIKGFGRIWRLPSTFIIDRHGVLVKNGHEGDPEVTLELLESVVSPLLKSQ